MDSEKGYNFAPLNDTNYATWHIRMEARLIQKDCFSGVVVIDKAPPEDTSPEEVEKWYVKELGKRKLDKMQQARAEMILRVEDSQLEHMQSKDPKEVWEELRRVHVARGLASRLAMRRRWLRLKKGEDEPMSAWVGRVRGVGHKLVDMGVVLTDEDKILALTNGLDDTYESFVISLDSTPPKELTLELVTNRLLNEEVRRQNKVDEAKADGKDGSGGPGQVFMAAGGRGKGYAGGAPGGYVSGFAGQGMGAGGLAGGNGYTGGPGYGPGYGMGPRACWVCGEVRHIKQFCPKRVAGGGQASAGGDGGQKQVAHATWGQEAGKDLWGLRDLGTLSVKDRQPGQVL